MLRGAGVAPAAPRQEEAGPAEAQALPQRVAGGAGGAGIAAQEDEGARRQPAAVDAGGEEYINTSILYYYQGGPQGPNPASPAHGFYIDFEGFVGAWKGLAISSLPG